MTDPAPVPIPNWHDRATALKIDDRMVIDGRLITSKEPGTAADFALAIVGQLVNEKTAAQVGQATLFA